jgi:FMN phosphatase YigB (HAD superfamily)
MKDSNPRDTGNGWIGVDLDGTLAHYDHYRGDEYVGKPVEEMVKRVKKWIAEGRDVRLFTARKPHPAIRRWMAEHLGVILPITNLKDHHMQALYDDRVVQVKRNMGETHPDHEKQVWSKR